MAFAISISKTNTLIQELPGETALKDFIANIAAPYAVKKITDTNNNHTCDIITTENGNKTYIIIPENNTIELKKRVPDGTLTSTVFYEPYAGIDIEYIPDNKNSENAAFEYRPSVLMEKPDESNILRTLIWDGHHEDYIHKIECPEKD